MLYWEVAETLTVAEWTAMFLNCVKFAGTLCSNVAEFLTVAEWVANTLPIGNLQGYIWI